MKEKNTSEFVGSIIGSIIGLAIINSVALWRPWTHGVVLESWNSILWAANFSLMTQIAGNLILAFYRPARLYSIINVIIAAAGFLSVSVFFAVFPLDFSLVIADWFNTLVRVAVVIGMFGTLIALIVHLVRAILGTQYRQNQNA
jgi:hypothetical protein